MNDELPLVICQISDDTRYPNRMHIKIQRLGQQPQSINLQGDQAMLLEIGEFYRSKCNSEPK